MMGFIFLLDRLLEFGMLHLVAVLILLSLVCLRRPLWTRGGWGLRNRRPVCIA